MRMDAYTLCGVAFYPLDHLVFASDCPFDPEKGLGYIRNTIRILDPLELSKVQRHKIYYKNLEKPNLEKPVGRDLSQVEGFRVAPAGITPDVTGTRAALPNT